MKRRTITLGSLLLVWLAGLGMVRAAEGAAEPAPPAARFEEAARLYQTGKASEAAVLYEQMLSEGRVSVEVLANLGNARFRNGEAGRALAAWHRALRLAPRDRELRANVAFVRQRLNLAGPAPGTGWLDSLSINEWGAMAGAGVWLWAGLLLARTLRPTLQPRLRGYTLAAGVAAALLAALYGGAAISRLAGVNAIIVGRDTPVRLGPLEEARSTMSLAEGTEVHVRRGHRGWFEIELDGRRLGWVDSRRLALTDPTVLAGGARP